MGRLVGLITELEPKPLHLQPVEVDAPGGEELQLHPEVVVAVEEGVLEGDRAGGQLQIHPHAHLQGLKPRAVRYVPEEGRPKDEYPGVGVGAVAALGADGLLRGARLAAALGEAGRVRRLLLRQESAVVGSRDLAVGTNGVSGESASTPVDRGSQCC